MIAYWYKVWDQPYDRELQRQRCKNLQRHELQIYKEVVGLATGLTRNALSRSC
jgi:hypothetical protein